MITCSIGESASGSATMLFKRFLRLLDVGSGRERPVCFGVHNNDFSKSEIYKLYIYIYKCQMQVYPFIMHTEHNGLKLDIRKTIKDTNQ